MTVVASLGGCAVDGTAPNDDGPTYPAANLDADDYRPGTGWRLVWSDEFSGSKLDETVWTRQVEEALRFNGEWQRYTASGANAYVDGCCLVIKAIHEGSEHGPDNYTSARLHTRPERGWRYGKIAARIQLPYGRGIWPAFWMLGSNIDENGGDTPWPQSGEIDIMEFYGTKDDSAVEANAHYADASDSHDHMGAARYELDEGRFAERFHVFEIEWDERKIAWLVDGTRYASMSITGSEFSEFHKEFFILLNMAISGERMGPPDETTVFPQVMYVDWVRVYQQVD